MGTSAGPRSGCPISFADGVSAAAATFRIDMATATGSSGRRLGKGRDGPYRLLAHQIAANKTPQLQSA